MFLEVLKYRLDLIVELDLLHVQQHLQRGAPFLAEFDDLLQVVVLLLDVEQFDCVYFLICEGECDDGSVCHVELSTVVPKRTVVTGGAAVHGAQF